MQGDQKRGNVEPLHFEAFQNDSFAMLGLIKSSVIIGGVRTVLEVLLAPLRKLSRGVTAMIIDM